MKTGLLLSLLLVPALSWGVVGGRTITDGSYRQTVALTFKDSATQSQAEIYCSGTLIGPRLVLTAAHCITLGAKAFKTSVEEFPQKIWIYIGDSMESESRPWVVPQLKVARVHVHPQPDIPRGDLALLVLEQDVDLAAYQIQPAPMTLANRDMIGRELTHVGYGMTVHQGVKGTKASVSLPLRAITGYNGLEIGKIFEQGPGACHGDSGGSAYLLDKDGQVKFIGVETSISNHPCGEAATYFVPVSQEMFIWIRGAVSLPLFE